MQIPVSPTIKVSSVYSFQRSLADLAMCRADVLMKGSGRMTRLDSVPVVGSAEFSRLAATHGWVEAEEIPMEPLALTDGTQWLRSRAGQNFVRSRDGAVVAVLSRDPA